MALRTARTAPRPLRSTTQRWWQRPDNVIVLVTLILIMAVATMLHPPPKVPPVHVVNESTLTLSLAVRPSNVSGWMDIGTFRPGQTTVQEIIDQGDTWLVTARAGSRTSPPFAVSRSQMRDQHWKLTVPQEVTDHLRRNGAVPEP
jgi:hypothetical protein